MLGRYQLLHGLPNPQLPGRAAHFMPETQVSPLPEGICWPVCEFQNRSADLPDQGVKGVVQAPGGGGGPNDLPVPPAWQVSTSTTTLTKGVVHPPSSPATKRPTPRLHAVPLNLNSCRKVLIFSSYLQMNVLSLCLFPHRNFTELGLVAAPYCSGQAAFSVGSVFAFHPSWNAIFSGGPTLDTVV